MSSTYSSPDPNAISNNSHASNATTEAQNTATADIDALDTLSMVDRINTEDQRVALAVATQREPMARAIDAIVERMQRGGRLIYVGAGTSGRLGVLDASEMPPTYSVAPERVVGVIAGGHEALTQSIEGAEDSRELGQRDLAELHVNANDCVLGISANGGAPYVLAAMAEAQTRGALVMGLTCNGNTPMHTMAEIVIAPVVGPEVISGSTRMKAGTATKLVLNTLSTGVMIRLGKTYGNLMVDVQPKNAKLRERARRIVARACTIDEQQAAALLDQCDGEVKTAIVAGLSGALPDMARAALARAGGVVRLALNTAPNAGKT